MKKKTLNYSETFKLEALKAVEKNKNLTKDVVQYDSELVEVLDEVKRFKREFKIAREERDILLKSNGVLASTEVAKCAFIHKNRKRN